MDADLPILPRIRRAPRIDISAILWPLQRAARTPRGRSAGRTIVVGLFVVALGAFASFNIRGASDLDGPASATPPIAMVSVHGHRAPAAFHAVLAPSTSSHGPSGALSRR